MHRLLRFFFYHFYHTFAWTYDLIASAVSLGRWNDWIQAALPYIEGWRVLELGHGPGHLQAAMINSDLDVIGLDESRQMSRQAARRLRQSGLSPSLVRGYAQYLPFGSSSFQTVVATFPTEYIVHTETLSEVLRVLTPGGLLVALPMAWIGGRKLPERGAAWLFRVTGQTEDTAENFREKIKVPFTDAGFEVQINQVEVRSSTLLFVLARKPKR